MGSGGSGGGGSGGSGGGGWEDELNRMPKDFRGTLIQAKKGKEKMSMFRIAFATKPGEKTIWVFVGHGFNTFHDLIRTASHTVNEITEVRAYLEGPGGYEVKFSENMLNWLIKRHRETSDEQFAQMMDLVLDTINKHRVSLQ